MKYTRNKNDELIPIPENDQERSNLLAATILGGLLPPEKTAEIAGIPVEVVKRMHPPKNNKKTDDK